METRVVALLAGAVMVAGGVSGCIKLAEIAFDRPGLARSIGGSGLREHQLTLFWTGRTHGDLEREWGTPSFVLDVPGFPDRTAIVVVFVGKPDAAGCIDAFVVHLDHARTIAGYVCR